MDKRIIMKLLLGMAVAATGKAVGNEEQTQTVAMPSLTVIGSKDNVERLPGSGEFIDMGDIRRQSYDDINQLLRRVPGVYLRQEDGYGLFPNISLRGVDGGRSSKLTIMEDNVLAAPAPYAAPSAYYSPTVGRMSGTEVLKGSSQVKYGPQTSGGVINYLSTPIPQEQKFYSRTMFGTDNEFRHHMYFGDRIDTEAGRFGYLIEYYERRNDGFKTIDSTPDFLDTDRTGFRKSEPMLKLSWEPNVNKYQYIEFKIGHTDLEANETYMGLTDEDFKRDPYRRYAGSRFDRIDTEQTRTHIRHHIELSPELRLTTTAYYNEFKRNWFKETSTGATLGNPARLAVLKGEAAGTLTLRNNNREYYSAGVESVANYKFESGDVAHDIDLGIRLHQDQAKRFQRDDVFTQDANGAITSRKNGTPGGAGNRKEDVRAVALFAQDAVTMGALTLVPGVRYEHIRNEYTDYNTSGNPNQITGEGDATMDIFAPGLGVIYTIDEKASIFGGVYRGFSVPGPRANAKDNIKEETSIGYELGLRYNDRSAFNSEVTFFYTDFNDLIVPDILGAGGGTTTENVGDVNTYGMELKLAYDLGIANGWSFKNPWYAALTLTKAKLDSDVTSVNDESIFAGGRKGAKVPYIPEVQFLIGTGLETTKWGLFVDLNYVDETFSTASNVDKPMDINGNVNYNYGKTDSYVTLDVSGHLRLTQNVKLVASVHNLLDEEYIAARHPAGPRPGAPLTALAGLEFDF
ncbi:MAG TPA: TonB-dependent receptor [Kiritimatiellia bacterium]|nr:TonB-dependent receptor [Kiritimatiellia bacterium]